MNPDASLAWHEVFFLERVRAGCAMAGHDLTGDEEGWLRSPAGASENVDPDRIDRLAQSLRVALDHHIRRYPEEKRVSKHIGVPVPPPVVRWRQAYRAIRLESCLSLRLVVERWHARWYRRQWLAGLRRGGWLP